MARTKRVLMSVLKMDQKWAATTRRQKTVDMCPTFGFQLVILLENHASMTCMTDKRAS